MAQNILECKFREVDTWPRKKLTACPVLECPVCESPVPFQELAVGYRSGEFRWVNKNGGVGERRAAFSPLEQEEESFSSLLSWEAACGGCGILMRVTENTQAEVNRLAVSFYERFPWTPVYFDEELRRENPLD